MQPIKSFGGHIIVPSTAPSAIPIVAPSEAPAKETSKPVLKFAPKASTSAKRLCRNVIIHGFCKFEEKGCEFNHDGIKATAPPNLEEQKPRLHSPKAKSTPLISSVSADSVNAPVFVPKAALSECTQLTGTLTTSTSTSTSSITTDMEVASETEEGSDYPSIDPSAENLPHSSHGFSRFTMGNSGIADISMIQPTTTMDPYYYMNQAYLRQPLQYHMCAPSLPHVSNLHPHQKALQSFFIADNLREQLSKRSEAMLVAAPGKELGLPLEVHVYHSLYPLEDTSDSFLGHTSWTYKATSRVNGKIYSLVRIEGFRLVNEQAMKAVESWRRVQHCNLVCIREAFTTRAFGDSSLVFVYDYHPCAMSLFDTYFTPQAHAVMLSQRQVMGGTAILVSETTLWSYITQITSALKTIHAAGLAIRTLEPGRVLLTGKNRLRLHCCSIFDVLQYDGGQNLALYQQEDLLSFGKIIVSLACNSLQSYHNLTHSFDYISQFYSPELKNVVLYLLSKPSPTKTIDEVVTLIAPGILHEINCSQYYTDTLESEIGLELENGRLVRLMSKLGFVNERPEFDTDPRWSETGDRYLIKLFRDYVFHQVNAHGVPVVDMAHVLTCLNKLDAGVDEKIMLMSRDEQACLIVSYKEIKHCLSSAFNDLC
ncbi:hypothetical protein BDF14DRAFT_1885920 [Spinellus fusiger]|nr:hypothetical protein BDF14DRAFT_1885920 [Spinellus fusiger]